MSKSFKFAVVFGLVALAAACAKEEQEYVAVQPISQEPVFTGKYK